MKINRGIIELGDNQTANILSVGHIYNLQKEHFNLFDFKDNQKLLGASTDNKFNICYIFDFNENKSVFGYITEVIDSITFKIQPINNFEGWNYKTFNEEYTLGTTLLVSKSDIKNIVPSTF